jgi:oligoendopeptidase F
MSSEIMMWITLVATIVTILAGAASVGTSISQARKAKKHAKFAERQAEAAEKGNKLTAESIKLQAEANAQTKRTHDEAKESLTKEDDEVRKARALALSECLKEIQHSSDKLKQDAIPETSDAGWRSDAVSLQKRLENVVNVIPKLSPEIQFAVNAASEEFVEGCDGYHRPAYLRARLDDLEVKIRRALS